MPQYGVPPTPPAPVSPPNINPGGDRINSGWTWWVQYRLNALVGGTQTLVPRLKTVEERAVEQLPRGSGPALVGLTAAAAAAPAPPALPPAPQTPAQQPAPAKADKPAEVQMPPMWLADP